MLNEDIYLTKRAEKNYREIRKYINEKWGENAALAFEQKIVDLLNLLIVFPEMGIVELKEKQIKGFQATRQTRIFYRMKGNKLVVISFFDVRQHPNKKY